MGCDEYLISLLLSSTFANKLSVNEAGVAIVWCNKFCQMVQCIHKSYVAESDVAVKLNAVHKTLAIDICRVILVSVISNADENQKNQSVQFF